MDNLIVETAHCFTSVRIETLEELLKESFSGDLEAKLVQLILSRRLENFRIDQAYLINENPKPVLGNLLKKLESTQQYTNSH